MTEQEGREVEGGDSMLLLQEAAGCDLTGAGGMLAS
jgi:hypothetical protein